MSDTSTETEAKPLPEGFDLWIQIDGQDIPAKKGETIIQASLRAGIEIPHYCWHPGLSIAGNCRMCLVYATKCGPPNKPVIACNTEVVDGMEVDCSGERTKQAREGVMEFLLINHPLDCPVCDQAGECDLQQYSFDHGRESSPFVEPKNQKPRKDFGPLIRFAGNRCIVCTRCVRFCDEVAGTGELTVVNRGDHSYIDTFPGIELDNPLSGCTADVCPVGALLEKDSIHTTRTWLLRGTKSVCGNCSSGCNINVETWKDEVRRLTPRENQAVNTWWMCDEGRVSHREAQAGDRLLAPVVRGDTTSLIAAEQALREVASAGGRVAALTTLFATNEELFMIEQLVAGGPIGVLGRPTGRRWVSRDGGFEISPDRNPNRRGAKTILGGVAQGDVSAVQSALENGEVDLLIVHDAIPGGATWTPELAEAAAKAGARVVISLRLDGMNLGADVIYPAAHWTEKDGTFVNRRGRLQRVRAGLPGPARPDLEILQELALARGLQQRVLSAGGVYRKLQAAKPAAFGELSYNAIGEVGIPLPNAEDTVPPSEARTGYEAGPVSRDPGRANDEQIRPSIHRTYAAGFGTVRGDF